MAKIGIIIFARTSSKRFPKKVSIKTIADAIENVVNNNYRYIEETILNKFNST